MALSSVTSEALQLKLRQLLPSQQGFGTDLSASDTIIPIIDLTAAAEGSDVPEYLQTALSFGSQTVYEVENATTTVADSPGFYRIFGTMMIKANSIVATGSIILNDGTSDKEIYGVDMNGFAAANDHSLHNYDFTVFLAVNDSLVVSSSNASISFKGSVRQTATVNGTLVQPSGFTPQ